MTTECAYELTSARPTSPAPKPQVTVKAMPTAKAGIVTVHGEVDSASARALTDAVHMSAQWFDQVVVDMGSVRLFSAAGVNALLEVDPERTAPRLVCSPAVLRVIALCGLERRWELHKSVFLALAWSVSRELPAVGETHRYAVRPRLAEPGSHPSADPGSTTPYSSGNNCSSSYVRWLSSSPVSRSTSASTRAGSASTSVMTCCRSASRTAIRSCSTFNRSTTDSISG